MKSALELVAFANVDEKAGTIALLETALDALDRSGNFLCAALVDHALVTLMAAEDADNYLRTVALDS